eukprot:5943910-Lingulodinium_polyedra.AAC.1
MSLRSTRVCGRGMEGARLGRRLFRTAATAATAARLAASRSELEGSDWVVGTGRHIGRLRRDGPRRR